MTNCEQDKKSLARSIRELREVIKSNVTDTSRLYDDFRKFNQNIRFDIVKGSTIFRYFLHIQQ